MVVFLCTTEYGHLALKKLFSINVQQQNLFLGLITFFTFVGAWECSRIMKFSSQSWKWFVFPVVAIVYYRFVLRFFTQDFNFDISDLLAIGLIAIACVTLFKSSKELYFDNGKFIFTIVYTALPFGFALGLPKYSRLDNSFSPTVFLLFILIFSSDSFAYVFGRLFGKHKMAPKISPKKTWEGYAGGVLCTLILGAIIEFYFPEISGNWIIIGFLVSIFAPLGDLVESQLKRNFGVKDSGNIIPGHGGVLDRLDSFIICAPIVYLYFIIEKMI